MAPGKPILVQVNRWLALGG